LITNISRFQIRVADIYVVLQIVFEVTMKEEDKYVGYRFFLQRKQLKLTQPEVGELCGVTGKTIGLWEKGSPIPSNQLTVLFENDFDIYYILTGGELQSELMIYPETDEATNKPLDSISCENRHPDNSSFTKSDASSLEASPTKEPFSDDYAMIPLYDLAAAAGSGITVNSEDIIDSLAFKKTWLKNTLNTSPDDLYLISIEGESMEPTLRPGDLILIDRIDSTAKRDGIYVIRIDDALLVKRIQRLPGNIIKVSSDNPTYEPFQINIADKREDIAIIGRVVWTGRRV